MERNTYYYIGRFPFRWMIMMIIRRKHLVFSQKCVRKAGAFSGVVAFGISSYPLVGKLRGCLNRAFSPLPSFLFPFFFPAAYSHLPFGP